MRREARPQRWKLCHTADWHLGHMFYGRSREPEHAAFLRWLLGLIVSEGIDVLLIAGDVFDTASPPGAAQALFYGFLAELRERAPRTQVIAVAGNHDSPARLSAPDPIVRGLGVRLIGALPWAVDERGARTRLEAESLIVPIEIDGQRVANVGAVPYLRAADLPVAEGENEASRGIAAMRRIYDEVARAARRASGDRQTAEPEAALVLMGHCQMAGARLSEASERAVIGALGGAPLDVLPAEASYVALGHLHLAQAIGGREHVRYSGSPIPLAFAEAGYVHQVCVVSFEGARCEEIRSCPVPRAVEMLRIAGPISALPPGHDVSSGLSAPACPQDVFVRLTSALAHLDASLPQERWPWLEVRVTTSGPEPGLRARIEEAVAGMPVRLVKIGVEPAEPSIERPRAIEELESLDLRDVFRRRWREVSAEAPEPEVLAALEEAIAEAAASMELEP